MYNQHHYNFLKNGFAWDQKGLGAIWDKDLRLLTWLKVKIIFIMFQYKWTMGVSDQGLYGYVLYGFRFLDEKNLRL